MKGRRSRRSAARRGSARRPRLFHLEEEICRSVATGDEEAEAARGRECAIEEDRCGPDAGPRDVAGCHSAKATRPDRKREVVKGMCRDWTMHSTLIGRPTITSPVVLIRPVWNAAFVRFAKRARYGCRRVHVLLEREGWGTNIKRNLSHLQSRTRSELA